MLIRTLLTLAAAVIATTAASQNIRDFKRRLGDPVIDDAGNISRVRVVESEDAAEAVRRADAAAPQRTVNGFRIVIFFDNGVTARAEAERTKAEFENAFADIRCDIRYENPYFKVLAGNCATSEDAVILLGRIRRSFPEAYIMREEIPLRALADRPSPRIEPDSVAGTTEL